MKNFDLEKASAYNSRRLDNGEIRIADISTLTAEYQRLRGDLTVDGKLGPATLAALEPPASDRLRYSYRPTSVRSYPLPDIVSDAGLLEPVVTSDHYLNNPSRGPDAYDGYRGHQGVDFMYRYNEKIHPPKRELQADRFDGKFWVPINVEAYSVGTGFVHSRSERAYNNYITLQLNDGWRVTYRHLGRVYLSEGDPVTPGAPLGVVGAMRPGALVHLHFEVYSPGRYEYTDSMYPGPFLSACTARSVHYQ